MNREAPTSARHPNNSTALVTESRGIPSNAALENPGGYAWLLLVIAFICLAIALYASGFFR